MIIMKNMLQRIVKYQTKAFTLLESLLTLAITCFIVLVFSFGISNVYQKVSESLFFIQFEMLYRETQQLSALTKKSQQLKIEEHQVSNQTTSLVVPHTIQAERKVILFDNSGGNSSLTKLIFKLKDKTISYQLYIGNGNFKKKED